MYGEALEEHLPDLAARLKRGAFRGSPVRRAYIPKGRQRPLGVPTLEDKIVQRAVVEVLNAIYESDCLGFSYGCCPKRSPHHAGDALTVGIETKKVNWVLDADICGFFDTLDHGWLLRFLEPRVADRRIGRLIQKWLRAGVLEDGQRRRSQVGTVQGGSISPLLANLARFGLALHPDTTRLIEFGRYAERTRRGRGDGKPETFNFLGFTHSCGTTRRGEVMVFRQTMRQRWRAKLQAVKTERRRRLHDPIPDQGRYLRAVRLGQTPGTTACLAMGRVCRPSASRSRGSGGRRSCAAARPRSCRGSAWLG